MDIELYCCECHTNILIIESTPLIHGDVILTEANCPVCKIVIFNKMTDGFLFVETVEMNIERNYYQDSCIFPEP